MFLDASSGAPISFIVNAINEKSESKQLANEIIVNVVPSFNYTRPIYFENTQYDFEISENDLVNSFLKNRHFHPEINVFDTVRKFLQS